MTARRGNPASPASPARRTRAGPGEAAISSVLGAVLLFGIFVVALVTVNVKFVPVWDEEREARHMERLGGELRALKADLDRQAGNATAASLSAPLSLKAEGGFMSRTGHPATVSFGALGDLQVSSPLLKLQVRGGQPLFGLDDEWIAITTGDNVDDVQSVEHLRLRIDMDPGDYDDGDSATLTVLDAQGALAGRAQVNFLEFPSENALEVRTFNRNGQEISSDVEAFFQQTGLEYFYFDLLDPALLFDDVLASAEAPLRLSLAQNGLATAYTIAYTAASGAIVGGGGLELANYTSAMPSGALSVRAANQQFATQSYVLEHGALILEQPDGAAMLSPPQLHVALSANTAWVDWLAPALSGSGTEVGSTASATILIQPFGSRTDIRAAAAEVSLEIPTGFPAVWQAFLADRLGAAGFNATGPQPHYVLNATASSVVLRILGPLPANDATQDIALRLRHASIETTIRPSG